MLRPIIGVSGLMVVFGDGHYSGNIEEVVGELWKLANQQNAKVLSGRTAAALSIPSGTFTPCTVTFLHRKLPGASLQESAQKLIDGMGIYAEPASLQFPKLDFNMTKTSKDAMLTMRWQSCDAATIKNAVEALASSHSKGMPPKAWWEFWK